jgi:hypothetical protein
MDKPVSVFVCGVQKGGTTSLYAHLREHPSLSPPSHKEIHFFDDETTDWRAPEYATLDRCFSVDDRGRLRFDATPIYCFWPPALSRIQAYNSAAKLIFLFRDPFDRAWSQWRMEYERGDETLSFAVAIREGRRRMDGLSPLAPERRIYSYVERGFYAEQVVRALSHFPRDQMLFLRSEDLYRDHLGTLKQVAAFLRIDEFPATGPKRENTGLPFASLPVSSDRAYFAELLREDVRAFSSLTGLDVSDWQTVLE